MGEIISEIRGNRNLRLEKTISGSSGQERTYLERIDDAVRVLLQYDIEADDLCIVGGCVLEHYGLRNANDIDFAAPQAVYERLRKRVPPEFINDVAKRIEIPFENGSSKVDIKRCVYSRIGVTDENLFNDPSLTRQLKNGLRIARLELEFDRKLIEETLNDRLLIEDYACGNQDWDWGLVPTAAAAGCEGEGKRQSDNQTFRAMLGLAFRKVVRGVKHPRQGLQFVKRLISRHVPRYTPALIAPSMSIQLIDIGTLVQWQFKNNTVEFDRYDTLLRLKTFIEYARVPSRIFSTHAEPRGQFSQTERIFADYERMQEVRVGRNTNSTFKALIHSMLKKGYLLDRYPISLSKKGKLLNGSHRFAGAIALNASMVPVKFGGNKEESSYGRDWFVEAGFEGKLIDKLDDINRQMVIETGAAFQVIIWPPAYGIARDIFSYIGERFRILETQSYTAVPDIAELVREVYVTDDIERWKVEKKIFHMKSYKPRITSGTILIGNPEYRGKGMSESYLSTAVENLKKAVRQKYKPEIPDYIHDVIIHIGDNPSMNRGILDALRKYESFKQ